jgi:ferritin-like protein
VKRSISELVQVPPTARDLSWLQDSLQSAIELEFSTIPIYLCAMWSITDQSGPVYDRIRSIVVEEMLHLGLACNMLTTLGGAPDIVGAVPSYPGQGLPGGISPDLQVTLAGLTKERVATLYMAIEYPEGGPVVTTRAETFPTIGAFYDAILATFTGLQPTVGGQKQLTYNNNWLYPIATANDFITAISEIKEQGEGTSLTPEAPEFGGEIAHYYKFWEIVVGQTLVQQDGQWSYSGEAIPFPSVYPMAEVPAGGFPDPPQPQTEAFNTQFTTLVQQLQAAWDSGDDDQLSAAVGTMFGLGTPAQALMQITIPDTSTSYGPPFQLVSSSPSPGGGS